MKNLFQKLVSVLSLLADMTAKFSNIIGTLIALALVVVINYDVVARGVFHAPFHGAVEIVQFSMVLIVFLQLPDVVRVNRLTRSDGFLVVIGHKFPRVAAVLTHVIDTVSAVFMALIAITIWPEFTHMLETKDYFGIPGVFTAPWWPVKLAIFFGAFLSAILFGLKLLSKAHAPELIRAPEHETKS